MRCNFSGSNGFALLCVGGAQSLGQASGSAEAIFLLALAFMRQIKRQLVSSKFLLEQKQMKQTLSDFPRVLSSPDRPVQLQEFTRNWI